MAEQKEYPEGIRFFPRNPKAPDFIMADASIDKQKLMTWLDGKETDEKGYIKLQLLDGKDCPYFVVNNYKPQR